MDDTGHAGPESRRIHMGTLHGTIEGDLRVSQRLRTLDLLNRNGARFIRLHDPRVTSASWHLGASAACVNPSFVFWVAEVTALRPAGTHRAAPLQRRSGVRLCLPDCEILGFLHTPELGDPILRLNQETTPFFALTSASMIGPDLELAAAFLAVNRANVFAAEAFADPAEDLGEVDDLLAAESAACRPES